MCCNDGYGHGHEHHHSHQHHGHHECCCDESCCEDNGYEGKFHRRYQTKAEVISELEEYLAELKAEALAVEEKLTELRK